MLVGIGKGLLLVAWRNAVAVRNNPNLQKMHRFGFRVVELAVLDAGSSRHHLYVARQDHRPGPDAILVFQRAFEDVGDDLHVLVSMGTESLPGAYPILVDHPQRPEAHVSRIVIVTERECVPAVEPSQIGGAALCGVSYVDHSKPRKRQSGGDCWRSAYKNRSSAAMVSAGRSSRIQWPVFSRTITV